MRRFLPVPAAKWMGEGPVLLFLHGIGGNKDVFDPQLAAFSDKWRAAAWDMPGYGESELRESMTFELLADSLARLVDDLGVEDVDLVGHSMGGMVAQEFVARYPGKVRRLVLAGTSPAFGKPGGDWQKEFLAARLQPLDEGRTPADFATDLVEGMFGRNKDQKAMSRAALAMAELSADSYRAALNCIVTFNRLDSLADIHCPTLLISGSEDGNSPPKVVERMAQKIAGAEYVCMEGAGHLMTMEEPEAFNDIVRRFLDRHPI